MTTTPTPPLPPDDPFSQFDPDEYLKKRLPDRPTLTHAAVPAEANNDPSSKDKTSIDDALSAASPLIRYGLIAAGCIAAFILVALVVVIIVLAVSLLRR